MANKVVNYKKIRTDIINGKKRCIYMKPKGKREYVKSKGEFVLLSVYIKKMQKKMKIKGGVGYIDERGRHIESDPLLTKVWEKLSDLKAKGTSFMRGVRGKKLDELVPDATMFNRRDYHENPHLYNNNYEFFNVRSLQNSKLKQTQKRQEARENAHNLGSKIRQKVLGNIGNREDSASHEFPRAVRRREPVMQEPIRADLVYISPPPPPPPQRKPTAPPIYPYDGIGYA